MKIPFEVHPGGSGYAAKFTTKSGKFTLSVVAGSFFYSAPRQDLEDPSNYKDVELAVFVDGEWASKAQLDEVFKILGTQGEYEYESNVTKPSQSVFGYVPIQKIEEIWNKC